MAQNNANSGLVLAGIGGSNVGGNGLAYFADFNAATYATYAPTGAASLPNITSFKDVGWCSEKGLTVKVKESTTDVKAFGTFTPLRTITTQSVVTFDVDFMESNLYSLAVYNRKPVTAAGKLALGTGPGAPATGDILNEVHFSTGAYTVARYSALFDLVDGTNAMRAFVPYCEVTSRQDITTAAGQAISYPVSLTAYPSPIAGDAGASIKWFYLLPGLIP